MQPLRQTNQNQPTTMMHTRTQRLPNAIPLLAHCIAIGRSLAVLGLIVFVLTLNTPRPLNFLLDSDQGVQLANAQKIVLGNHYTVDFNIGLYGPLVRYASALWQWLSGMRLAGEIVLIIVGYTFAYSLLYLVTLRLSGRNSWALAVLALLLLLQPRFYKYYIVLGPALFLAALWHFQGASGARRVVLLALATGVMGLFRVDYGAYGALVGLACVILANKEQPLRVGILNATLFLATGGAVLLAWLIFEFSQIPLDEFFSNTFEGITASAKGMSLPFPQIIPDNGISRGNAFFFAFWFFFLTPVAIMLLWYRQRRNLSPVEQRFIPLAAIFAQLVFIQALHRTDLAHLLQVIPVQGPLLAWAARRISVSGPRGNSATRIGLVAGLVAFLLMMWPLFNATNPAPLRSKLLNLYQNLPVYFYRRDELRAYYAQALSRHRESWRIRVIQVVRDLTRPDQPVLFLPYFPQFYYFAERDFATPTGHVHPGIANTISRQQDYIRALQESNTQIVVDLPRFKFDNDPARNIRAYMPLFIAFIEKNFPNQMTIGPAVVRSKSPFKRARASATGSP